MMVREREKAWKALFQCESRLVGLERTRERRGLSGNIIGWCFRAVCILDDEYLFFFKVAALVNAWKCFWNGFSRCVHRVPRTYPRRKIVKVIILAVSFFFSWIGEQVAKH